jgi:hypothetical protein
MWRKLIALTSLVFTFALAAVAASAGPAAAAPTSPGACHMLEASSQGLAGMDASQGGRTWFPSSLRPSMPAARPDV